MATTVSHNGTANDEQRPTKRFRYASPVPAPRPEPITGFLEPEVRSTDASNVDSPSLTESPGQRPKGKDNSASARVGDDERDNNFKRRFAGPSTTKAGLKRDPKEVEQIIYDASVGSKYFENEQRKAKETEAQVARIVQRLEKAVLERHGDLSNEEAQAEKLAEDLEATRMLDETIVVIDADAFYASVEELDDPSLKGKAFGVGQGVLTTASYEARKYGVRSAMAGFVAKKLCPNLIFVPLHFDRYIACSKKIMDILREYDPNISPASLDEAYMNITAYLKASGKSPADAVAEMRERVKQETGLTVSAGVAANKTLAKIAADVNKPDGQCVVPPTRIAAMDFMRHMPIRKVPGVGRVTEHWLTAVDIKHVGDVWPQRGRLLLSSSAESTGTLSFLMNAYLGLGSTNVEPAKREDRRSVGREDTFRDMHQLADLIDKVREIADTLGEDMERLEYSGRTVTLKLKLNTYEQITRAHTISPNTYFTKADEFFRIGKHLLEKEISDRHASFDAGKTPVGCHGKRDLVLRLLGLRVTNLRDEKKEAEKRNAKGSIHGWASKPASDSKNGSLAHPLALDDDVPVLDGVEGLDGATKSDHLPPRPVVRPGDLHDAICPICARAWSHTSQALLEAHVEACIARAQRQASPAPSKKSPPSSKAAQKSKLPANNAFSILMRK